MIIDAPKHTDVPSLRALWKDAFGDTDAFLDNFFNLTFSSERSLCAHVDNAVVGMLYWFDCACDGKKIAYLYAVATHKSYRGRGICHSLMNEAHRLLQARGYAGVILVPAEEHLFEFYKRMGYTTCAYHNLIHCSAEGECVEMHPITAEEYALRRPRFLPLQSVLQEGENLSFLNTLARLWKGKDFLLATRKDVDALDALELLGNTALAPRIIRTLGYTSGTFRTPGNAIPFAMFYPLDQSKALCPAYFAFAFD